MTTCTLCVRVTVYLHPVCVCERERVNVVFACVCGSVVVTTVLSQFVKLVQLCDNRTHIHKKTFFFVSHNLANFSGKNILAKLCMSQSDLQNTRKNFSKLWHSLKSMIISLHAFSAFSCCHMDLHVQK